MIMRKTPRIALSQKKWVELKKYVHARDQHCVFCGSAHSLTAAHIIRRSQGGNDAPNNVVCACVMTDDYKTGCHTKFDSYQIPLPETVREMLLNEPEVL